MEAAGLCQWCEKWTKDNRGRMGTCQVLRKVKIAADKKRGSSTVMKTLSTRIATHADDGCEDHFVEKASLFKTVRETERRSFVGREGAEPPLSGSGADPR